MERLTVRKEDGTSTCIQNCTCEASCGFIWDVFTKLADYEDAEEQGLLLRLPCKVGDTVYSVEYDKVKEYTVNNFEIDKHGVWCFKGFVQIGLFGDSVFDTQEEAEQKLESMKGEA